MVSQPTAQYGQTLGYCLASAMRSVQARAWVGRRSMPRAAIAATALLARLRPSNRCRERTAAFIDKFLRFLRTSHRFAPPRGMGLLPGKGDGRRRAPMFGES